MSEHASSRQVATCAEHSDLSQEGKPFVLCNECNSIFGRNNGGFSRYRPEAWVADQIEEALGQGSQLPVGFVYISTTDADPATTLGYGTWEPFAVGRVLVGIDTNDPNFDAALKTFGSKTHTLTESEMPSHTHLQNSHNHTQDAHSHGQSIRNTGTAGTAGSQGGSTANNATAGTTGASTATNQAATAVNQNTGGGAAHNNVQPSIAVYMYQRTA